MSIGVVETLVRVHHLGRDIFPVTDINSLKHRILMLIRALAFFPVVRRWYAISDNPMLSLSLRRFPQISGAMYWPYMNNTWPMERRLAAIDQHYRMLGSQTAIVAHATFGEVELARLDDHYAGLRLVLDKAIWFLREGEVVLNLFVNDQRLYSLAFTFGKDSLESLCFVGALQGSNSEAAHGLYRELTHSLHGMRPRDLLMVALKFLCATVEIKRIWAVSSENRQHNSPYFGDSHKEKVLVAYNEVWQEHGGVALHNGFFDIPAAVRYREMSEIPTRKRAAYRRRYQMLEKLEQDIKSTCARYKDEPLTVST